MRGEGENESNIWRVLYFTNVKQLLSLDISPSTTHRAKQNNNSNISQISSTMLFAVPVCACVCQIHVIAMLPC